MDLFFLFKLVTAAVLDVSSVFLPFFTKPHPNANVIHQLSSGGMENDTMILFQWDLNLCSGKLPGCFPVTSHLPQTREHSDKRASGKFPEGYVSLTQYFCQDRGDKRAVTCPGLVTGQLCTIPVTILISGDCLLIPYDLRFWSLIGWKHFVGRWCLFV